jgi:hypothetical protein
VAWNLTGGEPRLDQLERAAELLGVRDVEMLVAGVMLIRDLKAGG